MVLRLAGRQFGIVTGQAKAVEMPARRVKAPTSGKAKPCEKPPKSSLVSVSLTVAPILAVRAD